MLNKTKKDDLKFQSRFRIAYMIENVLHDEIPLFDIKIKPNK